LLKEGSRGDAVRAVQEMLNFLGTRLEQREGDEVTYVPLATDGFYGPRTEAAVLDFQARHGILADGIVGRITFALLEKEFMGATLGLQSPGVDAFDAASDRLTFVRVPADVYKQGYGHLYLRSDVAERYQAVYDAVSGRGAKLTSSGGRRWLDTPVTSGRSATSFHYTGRALDLFLYSGMVNPKVDPYVVVREEPSLYRVYARCRDSEAELATLDRVVTYSKRDGSLTAEGAFLDLTALFERQGFRRIRARPSFERGGDPIGAEWWHFQDETGLVRGVSTFGNELLKVYSKRTLERSPPWKYRDHVFGVNWN
jgi:hypothetical protein